MDVPAPSDGLPEHIVKSYDDELRRLRDQIVRMGGMVERQLQDCLAAVSRRDIEAAERVMATDPTVDALERDVDASVIRLLALRQPVAVDLRNIIGAMRIASDLERAGDYATNVAKRAIVISQQPSVPMVTGIARINRMALEAIKDVLDAFVANDPAKAIDVWNRDDAIDKLYTGIFREILTYMMEDARTITACTHLMFMAKNLERVGDHATNMAEVMHYAITGTTLPDARPKGDLSVAGPSAATPPDAAPRPAA
jgi:phosphate transport system protein